MSSPASPPLEQHAATAERLWTVEEYHALLDEGVLPEDGRYELLRGRIVRKMTKHPPHVLANDNTKDALEKILPSGWYVRTQNPIALADSEPEPDVVVAVGRKEDYGDRHPVPSDLAVVIEIAESSLADDRRKASIYAESRIVAYWIVNLISACVEVFTKPQGQGEDACYASITTYHPGQRIPFSIEGNIVAELPVDDLLP